MLRVRFAPSPTGYLHILTGQPAGPSAFAVFAALGRERSIQRLRKA